MKFTSESFADGGAIPEHHAFCIPDHAGRAKLGQNRNPQLGWSDLPPGTQSVVIICHDPDVPSKGDDVNKEGRTIPASLARVNFCHWVLIDMPASGSPIRDGEFSSGATVKGKGGPFAPRNTRQGLNDYTVWFQSDPNMAFALDVEKCPVQRKFTAADVVKALKGHILGTAQISGLYSLNPAVRV
jgi:phosphatidylethanolamine-binding protein (PEBP) family uncharacterized protein